MRLTRRDFLKLSGVAAVVGVGGTVVACSDGDGDGGAAADDPLYLVGLYSWAEIALLGPQLHRIDVSHVRIGGPMSAELMTFCVRNELDVLMNIAPAKARSEVRGEAAFVDAYVRQLEVFLSEYGTGGRFWESSPDLDYRPVTAIEVCNEPNFGYGFDVPVERRAALYAEVLVAAHDRIKAGWPETTVVAFSAGGTDDAAPDFVGDVLEVLAAKGRPDCFDVVSVHLYSGASPPEATRTEGWGTWVPAESLAEVSLVLSRHRVAKPVWITETGFEISQAEGGRFPQVTAAQRADTVTLQQQAAYTVRLNVAAVTARIARTYHMFATDSDDYNGGWFSVSLNPRPVAEAMAHFIDRVGATTGAELVLGGRANDQDGPAAYRFVVPDGEVLIAWAQRETETELPLPGGEQTVVTDLYGGELDRVSGDGYRARLTFAPIYLSTRGN